MLGPQHGQGLRSISFLVTAVSRRNSEKQYLCAVLEKSSREKAVTSHHILFWSSASINVSPLRFLDDLGCRLSRATNKCVIVERSRNSSFPNPTFLKYIKCVMVCTSLVLDSGFLA